MQAFLEYLEKFVNDFRWRRVLMLLLSVVFLMGSFLIYETYTHTNTLSKYEKTINLLKEIKSLELDSNISKDITLNIEKRLLEITDESDISINFNISDYMSDSILQALASSSIWILIFIGSIIAFIMDTEKKHKDLISLILGTMILAILIFISTYFIPLTWDNWIRYMLIPVILNTVIIFLLIKIGKD